MGWRIGGGDGGERWVWVKFGEILLGGEGGN